MPITNGVYTPLTFDEALTSIISNAPAALKFAPGNPPELIIANMFAQSRVAVDESIGMALAAIMTPVGSLIDLLNLNNPRKAAVATTGTIKMTNATAAPITVPPNTIITSASGQQYLTGLSSVTVPNGASVYTTVTCHEKGIAGNLPADMSFTADGLALTITNPIGWFNGLDDETDSQYLQRVTLEKTEYGVQTGSVAAETDIAEFYTAVRMYTNKSANSSTDPVPIPGNGYNCVVLTPNGVLENAAIMAQIFAVLSTRLEFVNAQNLNSENAGHHITHQVLSGTVYTSDIPQAYYYTAAQNIEATITAEINVIFSDGTDVSERLVQAVDFATFFIERLTGFFSGVAGSTDVTFVDNSTSPATITVTPIDIAANPGQGHIIAPTFCVAQINALVSDSTTRNLTPQLLYESTATLSIVLDTGVTDETPVTLTLVSATQFIDFKKDVLFSDGTSWYDRLMVLDPTKISVTITDVT